MTFEFATATRIIFGAGTAQQLPALARQLGKKILVVTGNDPSRQYPLLAKIEAAGLEVTTFPIATEPTVDDVRRGASVALQCGMDAVIGLGGGSAVDAGKAIAAMARQPRDVLHYLEVIGDGYPLDEKSLPFIAVPTTAGTGAEVTRNAVLVSPDHGIKASLRHASMLPGIALIDPELALGCPADITAASGMDALTQCLEAYVSCRAQPMTDALCVDGIRRAVRSLEKVVKDGQDLKAREDLALAAMFSGMALANAGLGAVHAFAAPIGGSYKAAHGAVCAALLAPVWEVNWAAAQRNGHAEAKEKFESAARLLMSDEKATPMDACEYLGELTCRLQIPGLGSHGIVESAFEDIATKAARASSMKGNPVPLSHEELLTILWEAL
ncbi:alcohol dehydrogenase class IV [Prosthecobacter fusiformis]|uniref:Alcohol dehydrogenase class IV n=1 Tax=Prosthecobacter fusiformis TaxID=48464 RepID=A0A4R7ST32_9BACT|nr:iron-containing alcohol dehydrogenase [Prosthecobacter fusiformis]TDU81859.1 alcohol dehydrogenase class IV [Prosthecobacter fusiformis]